MDSSGKNPRLETYLRRASGGVSGAQRREIQAELRGNICLRASELELLGLTHAQGVERALEELGAPNRISHGMTWVYTAPRAVRCAFAAMLAALCCAAPLRPLTVHVRASAVNDASGRLTGVNLEPSSFSMALAAAGIGLSDSGWSSRPGRGFTTAHAWNDVIAWNSTMRYSLVPPASTTANLGLTEALRALCDASARVNLEPASSEIVFRVTWQGSTSRIALNLEPTQALEFHAGVGRTLEHPCQR